jgi:hypothetical protein
VNVLRHVLLATALAAASGAAPAHDSWLRPAAVDDGGPVRLELTTGPRYPQAEVPVAPGSLVAPACTDGAAVQSLRAVAIGAQALTLEVSAAARPPLACWVELAEYGVDLTPALARVYLDDIHAPPAVQALWVERQARGVPWRERYRKFARIEVAVSGTTPAARAAARRPVGHGLELVVQGAAPLASGQLLEVQLLRDGRPLPAFPLQLVGERAPVGLWRTTDANGVVRQVLPFGGQWLLRGTDLRPAAGDPDGWESRFVTLVLQLP